MTNAEITQNDNGSTKTRKTPFVRPTGIGGTDANKLVHGEWLDLYDEKTGRAEPANLDDVLPVQMGITTEQFNREWFTRQTGMVVDIHEKPIWYNDYVYGSLDGTVRKDLTILHAVFEAKHTHAFNTSAKKKVEFVDKYYPQLQHYMLVSKLPKAYLSIFFGNMLWEYVEILEDRKFQSMLLKAYKYFWDAVQKKKPVATTWKEFHGIEDESVSE
jgi:predicted phage-related endonuclease